MAQVSLSIGGRAHRAAATLDRLNPMTGELATRACAAETSPATIRSDR
jgi:hypothetical protein